MTGDVEARLKNVERITDGLESAIDRIADVLQEMKVLAVRHEEHAEGLKRAFKEIERLRDEQGRWIEEVQKNHSGRLTTIEHEMPLLKLARHLVYIFVVSAMGMMLMELAIRVFGWHVVQ